MIQTFIRFVSELSSNPEVFVLDQPKVIDICHPRYCWFYYRDHFFYIMATASNTSIYPAPFVFCVYGRTGLAQRVQLSYYLEYQGLASIDAWLKSPSDYQRTFIKVPQRIFSHISEADAYLVYRETMRSGGTRERNILLSDPLFVPAETWDQAHRVVHVVDPVPDSDGHRASYSFDLITGQICG